MGRGAHQAYCILIADPKPGDDVAAARLEAMVDTTDGFHIAQRDLELRGAGELLGNRQAGGLRQHGITDLRVANLLRDHAWLERARRDAAEILAADRALARPEHRALADALAHRFGGVRVENARVG